MIVTPDRIAEALDAAPAWAIIALTMPAPRLREDARRELSEHVYRSLYQPVDVGTDQLPLPF